VLILDIVAVIPLKSSDFELLTTKNRITLDKSYLEFMIDSIIQAESISEICLYSSDDRFNKFIGNSIIYINRPVELDNHGTTSNEILANFVMQKKSKIYVIVHVNYPFTKTSIIEEAIQSVKSGSYDSALPVLRIRDYLWQKGRLSYHDLNNLPTTLWNDDYISNYDLNSISRNQIKDYYFLEVSSFYVFSYDIVVNSGRRIGNRPLLIPVSKFESINIKNQDDNELINEIISKML
jgi:CMP-N-acetylneuraminic acid synthetase